jgi:hypothetical protein
MGTLSRLRAAASPVEKTLLQILETELVVKTQHGKDLVREIVKFLTNPDRFNFQENRLSDNGFRRAAMYPGTYEEIFDGEVGISDPKLFMVFKKMNMKVEIAIDAENDMAGVRVRYEWTNWSGGRNGLTNTFEFNTDRSMWELV